MDITDEQARRRPGLRPAPYVRLTVTDTGVGMEPATLARVFEPFFTTKEPGKGTGLGLAMCYGIIKQASGFIGCESSKGVGTTCTVMLPPVTGTPDPPPGPDAASPGQSASKTTSAIILVVADESVVRQFVADVLSASGHVVQATGSAAEGLQRAAAQPRVDLLITDVGMPEMDGVALAARIRARQPSLFYRRACLCKRQRCATRSRQAR